MDAARFDEAVRARVHVLTKGETFAPGALREFGDITKLSDVALMRQFLSKVVPATRLDGRTDADIPIVFQVYCELAEEGHLGNRGGKREAAVRNDHADPEEARRRMIEESRNAWRRK